MTRTEIDLFGAPKTPCTHHEKPYADDEGYPNHRKPPIGDGFSTEEVNDGGDHSGPGGNGHADEVFAAWTSRVGRGWILLNVKARETTCSSHEKDKSCNCPQMD